LTKRLAETLLEFDQDPGLFPGELLGKMMKQGYQGNEVLKDYMEGELIICYM
jgi:hypothetical protein